MAPQGKVTVFRKNFATNPKLVCLALYVSVCTLCRTTDPLRTTLLSILDPTSWLGPRKARLWVLANHQNDIPLEPSL